MVLRLRAGRSWCVPVQRHLVQAATFMIALIGFPFSVVPPATADPMESGEMRLLSDDCAPIAYVPPRTQALPRHAAVPGKLLPHFQSSALKAPQFVEEIHEITKVLQTLDAIPVSLKLHLA